jgi:Transcriptional regulators containing a DNA-binding HTH domain and an aminotransferase domain (MocR family) and their eukaryotic orthologs
MLWLTDTLRNAGMFIWIDLRRFLVGLPAGADVPNLSIHRLSPEEKQEYQRREKEIGSRLRKNGVVIALGSNFFTEELGWFRLSFTAVKEALEVGLERIWKTLQEVEASGWNWSFSWVIEEFRLG